MTSPKKCSGRVRIMIFTVYNDIQLWNMWKNFFFLRVLRKMINTNENNYQNIRIFHFCYLHISWSFIPQFNQILIPENNSFEAKGLCINCIQDRGGKNAPYQFLPYNFSKSRKCPSKLSDLQFKPFRNIAVKFHTQYQSQIIET